MNEIKCPKCGSVFRVDEADYASILSQVRNNEFQKEIEQRMAEQEKQFKAWQETEALKAEQVLKESLNAKEREMSQKETEIAQLKEKLDGIAKSKELESQNALAQKDTEIAKLKEQINAIAQGKELESKDALNKKDNEIARLKEQIESISRNKDLESQNALAQKETEIAQLKEQINNIAQGKELEFKDVLKRKDDELAKLRGALQQSDNQRQIALLEQQKKAQEELQAKNTRITELEGQVKAEKNAASLREKDLQERFSVQLKQKQEQIDYYKDLKTRMSTKMVGETLEIHCSTEFNRVRASMYPRAYFEKDNDAKGGSKGDFIFRDYDEDGTTEYISIMFEMKNEMDETATKHKNEDFFAKLDKDRNEKACEYAVLVSLLEPDSELYNEGIVDVSYRYPKMFVVRPQFFMPLISLLSQASKKSIEYRKALTVARQQTVDVSNFEYKLNEFKKGFAYNYNQAGKQFDNAITEIDNTINHLNKIRDALISVGRNLRLASNKVDDLTIKKLSWNNPTMKARFAEARTASQTPVVMADESSVSGFSTASAAEAPSSATSHAPGPLSTLSGSAASQDSASQPASPDGTGDLFSNPVSPEGKDAL